jgi:sec-independent protein translocase protein TatA
MIALLQMPQGAEWLIILAVVVLLFGSTKLPSLVRSLGQSKRVWDEEVGKGKKKGDAQLTQGQQAPTAEVNPPVSAPTQQPAQQPNAQSNPGDGQPPSHTAN